MRVKVIGECDSAKALRGYLRNAGVCVTDFLPLGSANYILTIEEASEQRIICDSIPCALEKNVLEILHEYLSKLPDKPDVQLRRAGGAIHSDRELLMIVPRGDPVQQDAAERAIYLGLLRTTRWGEPRKPFWKRFFPLVLIFSLTLPTMAQKPEGVQKRTKVEKFQAELSKEQQREAPKSAVAPLTVIPLDDATKLRVVLLLRQQDKLIMQRDHDQLEIDMLEKKIGEFTDSINRTAQELAERDKIDPAQMILDLDRFAWVSKEVPK